MTVMTGPSMVSADAIAHLIALSISAYELKLEWSRLWAVGCRHHQASHPMSLA